MDTSRFRPDQVAVADAFAAAGYTELAAEIHACGTTERLAFCANCSHRWYVPNYCRKRVCPLCSFFQSIDRAHFIARMHRHMAYPKFVTLTMPRWSGTPQDGIRTIRAAFNKLRRQSVFARVAGGAYQIELEPKPNGWHIHLHALLEAPYIPKQKLFSAWRNLIGLPFVSTDIRAATSEAQLRYVCKYVAKAAKFRGDWSLVVRWYLATAGARLWATFGSWFNVTPANLEDGEEFHEFVPTCPNCGAEHSTCLARDAPFIYGHDHWREMRQFIIDEQHPAERPITQKETQTCSNTTSQSSATAIT